MGCGLSIYHKELRSSGSIQELKQPSIASFYALRVATNHANIKRKGLYAIIEEGASQEYSRAVGKSESLFKLQASTDENVKLANTAN